MHVCLAANTIGYLPAGGHLWVYVNWALGLHALGCEVTWLEPVSERDSPEQTLQKVAALNARLAPYGLDDRLALCPPKGHTLHPEVREVCHDLAEASAADLLLSFRYPMPEEQVRQFRRSALVDIDPGILQIWLSRGEVRAAEHDVYFSTGETVGHPEARFPDCGLQWQYTPPVVAVDWWPVHPAAAGAAFTTVTHWWSDEWVTDEDGPYRNDKRSGFLPFLELPRATALPLELALGRSGSEADEIAALQGIGWRITNAHEVSATPRDYQQYIQDSLGEFSCVKPSCVRLQNAWVSDRTLCYLASGKPVVIQHTGPSRYLPDNEGFFRFHDFREAVACLEMAAADYQKHCRLARALAEEYFDAPKVVSAVLERAVT